MPNSATAFRSKKRLTSGKGLELGEGVDALGE
jgi:hypothetical protein